MTKLATFFIATLMLAQSTYGANTTQTVPSVSSAIDLTTDVDYIITSASAPFSVAGSVNIVNKEHAVVILKNIKPSVVISKYLQFIYIGGEKAQNGVNCQVKMYGPGAIVFPYEADFRPLTVYSEPGFEGESCNDFGLENTGGFMNTLSTAKLNNRIRSFRLKRGYMVTFALGTGGWGYSRCFIADQADLEVSTMPANMDAKISSYRVFHWYNAQKKGIADCNDRNAISALGASWCYRMWPDPQGLDYQPDCEYIPHHYKENYPTYGSLGTKTFSCHIKGNNEPGNSADEAPCSVNDVLANWEEAMRTGMRLCSESSHDGSWNHLKAFIDSIDARGWRCDILDLHCYWASNFGNLNWYSDYYGNGRPIWISEWIWGASWNNNGAFGNGVTDNQIYDNTVSILNTLNSTIRVERYAYWNSESKAKIYDNGSTTRLGNYYASMNSGLGYNAANEYIPTVVNTKPTGLSISYIKSSGSARLTWTDNNGDMLDSMIIEYKAPDQTRFTDYAKVTLRDKNSANGATYTYNATLDDNAGVHYFRIAAYPIGKTIPLYSEQESVTTSLSYGNDLLQYGALDIANTDELATDFSTPFGAVPVVFMGLCSNKNINTVTTSLISAITSKTFAYQPMPWTQSGTQTYTAKEQIPFLAIKQGTYTYGTTQIVVGQEKVKGDTATVTFAQPFPEGTVPVVIAEINKPTLKTNPMNIRIWDITNTGFKAIVLYESGVGKNIIAKQNMSYMAVTPGETQLGDGITLSAGISTTPLYGTTFRPTPFIHTNTDGTISEDADTLKLKKPYIFGALQTFNIQAATALRNSIDFTLTDPEHGTLTYGTRVRRMVDTSGSNSSIKNTSATADTFGWICISTSTQTYEPTDVNQDGSVDTQDVLAVYEFMQTSDETTPVGTEDVNQDGSVDTQDMLAIYEYMKNN
ncbi:MAG: hypothetical protein IJ139_03800 [Bacteroidaceae bacterium]|nr:hypothetical protein [Bacteroidaceae bacterium]